MSKRVYTMRISGGVVSMAFDDFTALAGELTSYGVDVDVDIETSALPEKISFSLKESQSA
jgi:hypothetical protein